MRRDFRHHSQNCSLDLDVSGSLNHRPPTPRWITKAPPHGGSSSTKVDHESAAQWITSRAPPKPDAPYLWYSRPAGVSSAPGDSGAGFIKFFSYRDSSGGLHTWPILGGSLVNVALGVSPRYIADMVQAWIGAFYVSPMSNPNLFMVIDEAPRTTSTPGANNTKISYSSTTKQLSSLSGLCLNAWATAVPCNATDSTQRWRHTGDLQLKSEYSGYCLDPNGYYGHLQVVACNAVAEQAWVFRVGL